MVTERMLSGVVFVVTLWTVGGSDINISTASSVKRYISLTQYGYVYQPKTDCLAHFTFQVKACHDVHVGLFNEDGAATLNYEIVLGGWLNEKSTLKALSLFVEHFERKIVDCNAYRSFWVSWRNDVVAAGRGVSFNNDILLSITDHTPNQVRYIAITTGYGASGEWKIPNKQPSLFCFQQIQMKMSPGLWNTNMSVNVTWSVTADNLGQCAVTCKRSSSCMSFVYNNEKNTCQGHGKKFSNIAEGQGHTYIGSHYYIKP